MDTNKTVPIRTYNALFEQFNDVVKTLDNREKQIDSLNCMIDDYLKTIEKLTAQKEVAEIKIEALQTRINELLRILKDNDINLECDYYE